MTEATPHRVDEDWTPLESGLVLPEQLDAVFPMSADLQPEKRLMLAVLEEAVTTYMRDAASPRRSESGAFREAVRWLGSDDQMWPFSFVNICRALALEPAFLRRGLREWTEQRRTGPARPIRNPFRRMNGSRTKARGQAPGLSRLAREVGTAA